MERVTDPGSEVTLDQPREVLEVRPASDLTLQEQHPTTDKSVDPGPSGNLAQGTEIPILSLYTGVDDEQDTLAIIQERYTAFRATGDGDVLDKAIRVAEKMLRTDQHIRLVLNHLLKIREATTGTPAKIPHVPVKDWDPDYVASNEEGIRNFHNRYTATGDNLYIDQAKQLALIHISTGCHAKYEKSGKLEYLSEAIKWGEQALAKSVPRDIYSRPAALNILGKLLQDRHDACGAMDDLDRAIKLTQESHAGPPDYRQTNVLNLAVMLQRRYLKLGVVEDLDQAIQLSQEEAAGSSPNHPTRLLNLSNLSGLLLERYQRSGSVEDLEFGIKLLEQEVSKALPGNALRKSLFANLGLMTLNRYGKLGNLEDLDKAMIWNQKAVEATSRKEPGYGPRLGNLGKAYFNKYQRFGGFGDLEQAIKQTKQAVAVMGLSRPDRAIYTCNLGQMLFKRYMTCGGVEDLNQAITLIEGSMTAFPSHHPARIEVLNSLAVCLQMRSHRSGIDEDLESSIKLLEEAVSETLHGHPQRSGMLSNLSLMTMTRFEMVGDLKDLDKAISWSKEAAEATPPNHHLYGPTLGNYGRVIMTRYKHSGAIEDLEQAIQQTEEALKVTALHFPDRDQYLGYLGEMRHHRYNRLGVAGDLDKAMKWTEEAVAASPTDSHRRPFWFSYLGALFKARYTRLGALEDLEEAIKQTRAAITSLPSTDINQPTLLSNLGLLFLVLYGRSASAEHLDEGVRLAEEALASTPETWPATRAEKLNTLALVLGDKYKQAGDIKCLDRAIKYAKEALMVIPAGGRDRPIYLRSLGSLFEIRYRRFEELDSLESAIKLLEEATGAQPLDHPERAWTLISLSKLLIARFNRSRSGSSQDRQYILRGLFEAWHCHTSPPAFRIVAGTIAANELVSNRRLQEASSLLADVIKMLPKDTSGSLGMADQEFRMAQTSSVPLVPLTISISLQAGEGASHCLRLAEFGRGTIMGRIIDCRGDLSELRMKHPEVSDYFDQLRIEIDSPLPTEDPASQVSESSYQQARRRREKVADELDEIIVNIRTLPGFEAFNLPPQAEDLMLMASEGPIVIVNSTKFRSDAIIVTTLAIKSLNLPKLSSVSVEQWMGKIGKIIRGPPPTYAERNAEMAKMLRWLWNTIVEPVLQKLGFEPVIDSEGSDLPHIWWIGVGLLGMAPFHAAGYHSPASSTRNTISRTISSYTPTIKALAYARQRKLELLTNPNPRILTVTMPITPGKTWKDLANATGEVEQIADLVSGKASTTLLECPSAAQVLATLPSHDAIHFACHGVTDPKIPSKSALVLRKENGQADHLTVQAISRINVKHAQIAYLSACSTAENSGVVVDESMHIASGFQLAGFSHVLATQWESNDEACRQVAADFYKALFDGEHGEDQGGHRKVSASFHCAVKRLRKTHLRQPIKWGSFIHTGA